MIAIRALLHLPPRLLVLLTLGAVVAGCGVKGEPEPPAGERAVYPRTYPETNRYPQRVAGEDGEAPRQIDPATGEEFERDDIEIVEEDDDEL